MGARGPQPKPTSLKRAAGNPGRRQLNEHEPLPPEGEIVPPPWLSAKARSIWDAVAPVAIAMKTLTTADVLPFARYCTAFARWLELTQWLEKNGTTYTLKDARGKPKYAAEFPQAIEQRRMYEVLIRLESHFGLTAASRTRLHVVGAPNIPGNADDARNDSLRDFFAGGGPAATLSLGATAPEVITPHTQAEADAAGGDPAARPGRAGKPRRARAGRASSA